MARATPGTMTQVEEANEPGVLWEDVPAPQAPAQHRSEANRGVLLGEALVVAAWASASVLLFRVLDSGRHRTLSGSAAAILFVVATGVMVVAILAFGRMSSRRIRQGLRAADLALRSMEIVTDPALSFLPLNELLDELLRRTRDVVGGDVATVFLLTPDRRFLTIHASRGLEQWMVVGAEVPVGEGVIGSVASRAQAVIVPDVARVAAAMPLLRDRVASIMAAPLLVEDRVIGVVQVGTRAPHRFRDRDLRLLQLVADRAAASVERARLDESERRSRLGAEQARRHLDLLTRASDVLATALESYEETFVCLVEVVVPSFADWFAVDLVDETGRVARVAYGSRGELPHGVAELRGGGEPDPGFHQHRHPDGDQLVQRALLTGRPEVVVSGDRSGLDHGGALAGAGNFTQAVPGSGVESMIVVPVHVRGLAFGALSLSTGAGRRGYRRSDLDTALGLAERVAIAVERVLLWRETRQAEHAATRNAQQLRLLVEAALGVNAPLEEPEVLRVLAEHARHVLDVACAVVAEAPSSRGRVEVVSRSGHAAGVDRAVVSEAFRRIMEAGHLVQSDDDKPGPAWTGVPVAGTTGLRLSARRALILFRNRQASGVEGESMLVLLAQMASVALENARLYQVVQGNEERLRAVVDSSPLAIAELDPEGRAQWWNEAAATLFGWPQPGTPGADDLRVPVRTSNAQVLEDLWTLTRGGRASVGADLGAQRPDGRSIDLSVSTAPLRDHAGVVRGILAVMEDVTERRRMLEQFNQTERLGAMARLAGGVAHDFNNLLTVILGSSEILLRNVTEPGQVEEVSAIQRAGERAAALTSQLLSIGQRPPVQPVVVDPDVVIASLEPMLVRVLGEDIDVDLVSAALPQRIRIDPAELERALLNLAINAKDAMPEGGSFTIATAPRVTGAGGGHGVAITISDDGAGMDPETAAHCFEPFFTTKGRAHGTGLGLAAVHASVSQVGGTVTVDSEPHSGTSFTMMFPAATGEVAVEGDEPEANLARGDETVVVVEDEAELRRLEVQALEWRGYTVHAAPGGAEALELIGQLPRRPDLVVTDVVMPGVGGVELVSRLRRRWRTLPVLFVSGHLDEHELGDDPRGGAADLLVKPFTPEQLGRRVRLALDRAAPASRPNGKVS